MSNYNNSLSDDSQDNDGKIKINPYNCNNKLITSEDVNKFLLDRGITDNINNIDFYTLAFCHKSYVKKVNNDNDVEIAEKPEGSLELQEESNERMEFLGDSIISAVIAKYLFERFPGQDEGFLTRIRTKLVNGKSLANFATLIDLSQYLLISRHVEERCNGRENTRILEDAFESFIGALFLDFNEIELCDYINNNTTNNLNVVKQNLIDLEKKITNRNHKKQILKSIQDIDKFTKINNSSDLSGPGFQICQNFIIDLIESHIDFSELILKDTNYKDQLLRFFQHNYQITPKYKEESIDGPPHKRYFTMSVSTPEGNVIGTGKGKSKKQAEQNASKYALVYLGQLTLKLINDSDSE
jgi:dsRNA-specific ribonuclease